MLTFLTFRTRSLLLLIAILTLSNPCIAKDDNYLWPIRASSELTSGFCQWRPGHFHSGIDVRTFGKTGYEARAIADCYVLRIITRWRGYGKALYLKLDDGRIAVYGHMLKFTPEINRYIQEQQLATRRYRTDLYPPEGRFRFKAGDVVAYSGQSGTSTAPHLHFEIRTEEQMPLDPVQFYPSLKDDRSPVIRSISLRPLSPVLSRINGASELAAVTMTPKEGKISLPDTVVIYGPVGVELECVDKRPDSKRSYAVSGIEMYIDSLSAPFFVTKYDTISFDRWGEINLELNYSRALDNKKFVHNLYILPENDAPLVNDLARNRGWIEATDTVAGIDMSPGLHRLLFRVYDRSGNTTQTEIVIDLRCHPHFPGLTSFAEYCADGGSDSWQYSVAEYNTDGYAFSAVLSEEKMPSFLEYLNGDITLVSKFKNLAGRMILLSAKSIDGTRFERLIKLSDTGMPIFAPISLIAPSCLAPSPVASRYDPVRLDVRNLMDTWNDQTAATGSLCLDLPVLFDLSDSSLWVDPAIVTVRDIINVDYGRPFAVGGTGTNSVIVKFADGHLVVAGDDLLARSAICLDTSTIVVKRLGSARILRIIPEDLLLNDWVDLTLKLNQDVDTSRCSVFKLTDKGETFHIGGEVIGDSAILVKLSKTGTYAVLHDTVPPTISKLTPADGGRVGKSRPKISFRMDDDLSGIEDDTFVEITVDGVWAIPEYDIGTKWIVTYSSQKLKTGKHTLEIKVRDRAGNEAIHSSTFRYVK